MCHRTIETLVVNILYYITRTRTRLIGHAERAIENLMMNGEIMMISINAAAQNRNPHSSSI